MLHSSIKYTTDYVTEGMRYVLNCVILLFFQFSLRIDGKQTKRDDLALFNLRLERHFARESTLSEEEWNDALPSDQEKIDMKRLVHALFSLENFSDVDNSILSNYSYIEKWLNITVLEKFCVVHEKFPADGGLFPRNWGYIAIAVKDEALRPIHHSAAHFESDGRVAQQASVLAESTQSRSLVVAGASRYAVRGNASSPCQKAFRLADAAHNSQTMFHALNLIVNEVAKKEMGRLNRDDGHFFVQWHGMAETSCTSSDIFISTGIGNSTVYDKDIPATKIVSTLGELFPQLRATTPRDDVSCRLTAASNLFGRVINGVSEGIECDNVAKEENVTGRFVHIEQKAAARSADEIWTTVIQTTFPVTNENSSVTPPSSANSSATILVAIMISICVVFQTCLRGINNN